jgi:hypothetical protein
MSNNYKLTVQRESTSSKLSVFVTYGLLKDVLEQLIDNNEVVDIQVEKV